MIVDARSVPAGTIVETELCIIGAGAAGITLAREFIDAPFRIAAVAHNVAEAQGLVHLWTVAEDRVQRVPVGVDVRENRDLQASFS